MGRDDLKTSPAQLYAEVRGDASLLEEIHSLECVRMGEWSRSGGKYEAPENHVATFRSAVPAEEWDRAIREFSRGINGLLHGRGSSSVIEPEIRFFVTGCHEVDAAAPDGRLIELTPSLSVFHGTPDEHLAQEQKSAVDSTSLVIYLHTGWAFGTGTHPSTVCAIMAIEFLRRRGRFLNGIHVLDMGTGTGILAIAAALMGARSVTAVDIDPEALDLVHRNSRMNGVEHKITVLGAEEWEKAAGRETVVFDICLANLTLSVAKRVLPSVRSSLNPGAALVLSGFMHGALETANAMVEELGFVTDKIFQNNSWCALLAMRI